MGITQKLNMFCIRGHVYFMNFNAAYQISTTDNTHSVIKESDPPKWRFHNVTPCHENAQNSPNTRNNNCQQLLCDPRDAITFWQRRLMLPTSLWMAVISRLFHSSIKTFPSSTRVVDWTGRRKIPTCRILQACSIWLRSGENAGQSIWTMVSCWRYSPTTLSR